MQQNGEERRRYPRSRRGLSVLVDESGPGVLNHIDNISGNGVLCHTVKPVPLMTKMSIVLDLPSPMSRRIECEGIVVRCDRHEQGDDHFKVAIIYTKIDEEERQAIQDFVEHDLAHASVQD